LSSSIGVVTVCSRPMSARTARGYITSLTDSDRALHSASVSQSISAHQSGLGFRVQDGGCGKTATNSFTSAPRTRSIQLCLDRESIDYKTTHSDPLRIFLGNLGLAFSHALPSVSLGSPISCDLVLSRTCLCTANPAGRLVKSLADNPREGERKG